jgi:hypothetical protein
MKCIRCGAESKFKERTKGHCPACHKPFAFERGETMTDLAFKRALDVVSAEGRLRWGVEHLYYEVCRRKRRSVGRGPLGCGIGAAIAAGLLVLAAINSENSVPGVFALVAGAVAAAALWQHFKKTVPVSRPQFDKMWGVWRKVHGVPPGLIVRREAPPRKRPAEADVGDYSFDRAVICDRARTVDLLLANNFHFENNCAVLSIGGYPTGPFETVRAMLRRNPKLAVFALHDATPVGCRMAHKLAADPGWFQAHVRVVDVGLRPSHRDPFRGLFLPAPGGRVAAGEGLTAAEASWLTWYELELAAIHPEQVLKRLFRAINRKEAMEVSGDGDRGSSSSGDGGSTSTADASGGSGGGGVEQDADSFSTDASDSDGGADSFG